MSRPVHAFTFRLTGTPNQILIGIKIAAPSRPPDIAQAHEFVALWDTGATATLISDSVTAKCGHASTGKRTIQGVNSTDVVDEYVVDVHLGPVCFPTISVGERRISPDFDVLLGMDVIGQGDFAMTRQNGQTVVSFQTPHHQTIDFFRSLEMANLKKVPKGCVCVMEHTQTGQMKSNVDPHLVPKLIDKQWRIAGVTQRRGRPRKR